MFHTCNGRRSTCHISRMFAYNRLVDTVERKQLAEDRILGWVRRRERASPHEGHCRFYCESFASLLARSKFDAPRGGCPGHRRRRTRWSLVAGHRCRRPGGSANGQRDAGTGASAGVPSGSRLCARPAVRGSLGCHGHQATQGRRHASGGCRAAAHRSPAAPAGSLIGAADRIKRSAGR